jgi:hypothetical protein
MVTESIKRKVVKRIKKRIPHPDKITNLDIMSCANSVRFDWFGDTFLVDNYNFNVEMAVDGHWRYTNQAMLLEKLLQ